MKTIFLFLTGFLFLNAQLYSQPAFQKVTTGPLVTTSNLSNFAAWGDYDNDDLTDVVISAFNDNCHDCAGPLMLFKSNGDGSFTRITNNAIAQSSVIGSGLAWGDYDNDGKLDLFVCGTISSKNKLFHNEGNGNFTEIITGEIVSEINSSQSCAWADYDKDGWLDLFVTNRYLQQSNRLYKNNGDGTFTKVLSGSIVNDIAESRCCAWGDYDNDGWPDLFVVNYAGQNDFLYHNNQNGTFTRIMNVPMVNDGLWGSACQWTDFDNNGFIDLFVTNTDGNNILYYNHGNGNFTIENSVINESISYGLTWGDFNNDGLSDLFVCNPYRNNSLFRYNSNSSFTKIQNDITVQEGGYSVGASYTDYTNDGKLDIFVTNRNSTNYNYFYKNVTPDGNYLYIKLNGCKSNSFGIGARIKVVYGNNKKIFRDVTANSSWSQNMMMSHFGLGDAEIIDSLIVYWPSDSVTRMADVDVNQILNVNECSANVIGISNNTVKSLNYSLGQNYPNPFNPSTHLQFEISNPGFVSLKIYDVLGNEVVTLVSENKPAGNYEVEWNAAGFSSGIYYYKLESGDFISTRRMTLLK